jgi:glycosyltransferase involved in cell wall biosynthesis
MNSVLNQTYGNIEYIIIDGGSTDGTVDVIKKYERKVSRWLSEPDRGIYDAMNKGILQSSGSIIGFLNSDDMYADNKVIEQIVNCFVKNEADTCYGDLVYVDRFNINKTVRFWKSGSYHKNNFIRGWMPPHPTFFAKRSVYERLGLFNLDFPLAADYELMPRFLYKHDISSTYIPQCLVFMRTGGACSPGFNTFRNIIENYRSWKTNDLKINPLTFIMKPLYKTLQFKIKT